MWAGHVEDEMKIQQVIRFNNFIGRHRSYRPLPNIIHMSWRPLDLVTLVSVLEPEDLVYPSKAMPV